MTGPMNGEGRVARAEVLFFETHPIQYRAPVFQRLQQLRPDRFEVIYASDFSVRGGFDREFGAAVTWDEPLLSGYRYRVLGNDGAGGVDRWGGLTGRGVDRVVAEARPAAVVLHSIGYQFNAAAYLAALRRRIPIWYRSDTNERAVARTRAKTLMRQLIYRPVYAGMSKLLPVGALNRAHYRGHGVPERRLTSLPHCVPDRLAGVSLEERARRREAARARIGARAGETVVGFFGKLIEKKDPLLVAEAMRRVGKPDDWSPLLLFVGSGELAEELAAQTEALERATGVRSHLAGFVNQSAIDDYYLATDILVLPSRQAGETWGLVVNEALQAGCAVAVSEAAGCSADFGALERVRVFPPGDASALAAALVELAHYPRSLDWAAEAMRPYSVGAVAETLAREMDALVTGERR